MNDINGGSIRCYVCHKDVNRFDRPEHERFLRRLRMMEFEMALDTDQPYAAFRERIAELREDMRAVLKGLRSQGETIHIYGASTKGNVLLQYYGIDNTVVEAAAERNPHKVGGRTLGTDIPIISEEESRSMGPKYYLVLPWHFKREFIHREYQLIRQGVTFIFPLPQIEFINANNVDRVLQEMDDASISMEQMMFELVRKGRQ